MVMRSTPHKGEQGPAKSYRSAVRGKRNSITAENAVRKRRKVDQSPASVIGSPAVHIGVIAASGVGKHPASVVRSTHFLGLPLVVGTGDTGQLGLGPDVTERTRPAHFSQDTVDRLGFDETSLETGFVQVCAGGMHTVYVTVNGLVVTCGCNDEGALGRLTTAPTETAYVTVDNHDGPNGEVPCKDSALSAPALGNIVDETYPAYVPLPLSVKIAMVSAGDSHTAALDSDGQVWLWGTFRGPNGPIGLTRAGEIAHTPRRLLTSAGLSSVAGGADSAVGGQQISTNTALLSLGTFIVKVVSGQDHLVCLTEEGRLYTMGCGEQGQLGRIAERFARTGGRSGINLLLQPTECRLRGAVRFSDVWAGGFATIAVCQSTGDIFACGLNNYGQLALLSPPLAWRHTSTTATMGSCSNHVTGNGLAPVPVDEAAVVAEDGDVEMQQAGEERSYSVDAVLLLSDRREADKSEAAMLARQGPLIQFMLTRACGFHADRGWRQFAVGIHHTLALDKDGQVYAVGRPDYGRLGLGSAVASSKQAVTTVTRVQGVLVGRCCTWIGCGESCSFAVDTEGVAYSWGMGTNRQLAHGDDDEDSLEPGVVQGKQVKDRRVAMVDAGGQHTVLLAFRPETKVVQLANESIAVGGSQLTEGHRQQQHANDETTASVDTHKPSGKTPNSSTTGTKQQVRGRNSISSERGSEATSPKQLVDRGDRVYVVSSAAGEPLLVPPIGGAVPQAARRPALAPSWRLSPSGSVCGGVGGAGGGLLLLPPPAAAVGLSADSTTGGSTACATINSSSAVSDTSSVGSCASSSGGGNTGPPGPGCLGGSGSRSTTSSSSQWNSACSTDGGGSSRCSSAFDVSSVQSSSNASNAALLQRQTLSLLSSLMPPRDGQRRDELQQQQPIAVVGQAADGVAELAADSAMCPGVPESDAQQRAVNA